MKGFSTSVKDINYIVLKCSLKYQGNRAPLIVWKYNNMKGQTDFYGHIETEVLPPDHSGLRTVVSRINVTIDSSQNGSWFNCQTYSDYFEDSNKHVPSKVRFVSTVLQVWDCPVMHLGNDTKLYVSRIVREVAICTESSSVSMLI